MINDKSLEDRLNAIKNGNPLPEPPIKSPNLMNHQVQNINNPKKGEVMGVILRLIDTLFASFLYGYAFNTIFNLEWSLLGSLAVGFLFNHVVTVFPKKMFPNKFKK